MTRPRRPKRFSIILSIFRIYTIGSVQLRRKVVDPDKTAQPLPETCVALCRRKHPHRLNLLVLDPHAPGASFEGACCVAGPV